ncbi:MAG TPA: methylenetetrahydrofolate reductase [Solirubrobacteraceae bacterium]|nr:methylenetetrahydrofolate reductase [Solirubrobacteraceae bacterium]
MPLADLLASETFVVTAELGPPAEPNADVVRRAAAALAPVVHAANVTDNQAASVKMSPLAAAVLMLDAGLEPIMQMTGRDRNILALQADLLGAWALGVRSILALGGDPLSVGPYEGRATRVGDVDSVGMAQMIASLNAGRLLAGERMPTPTGFLVAGAANPLVDSVARLEAKVDSGMGLLQTNIVYDVDRFAEWFVPVVEAGLPRRAPVLVGVTPPRSLRMLEYLHERIPGVEVDEATFARIRGLEGEAAKDEGVRIAADVISRLREIDGVAGVHIMAPGWEVEAVPRVAEAAGLTARSAAPSAASASGLA